jgi:mannose-6-phosphate isomerase-like protein (cupin superfamily)
MPKVSKQSAQVDDHGIVEDCHGEVDGYTINILTFRQDTDSTPLLKGLPDDRCQCPHWGYVLKGKLTVRFPDHDEVLEAGDAFYLPPGHVPVQNEPGTQYVQFSPTQELNATSAVIMKNMEAMQAG